MTNFEDRVKGVLLSAALGDALGAPVEKLSRPQIEQNYGYVEQLTTKWYKEDLGPEANLGRHRGNGTVTDDTLMLLALCRVYETEKRHLDAYDLANEFVKEIAFRPTYIPEFRREALIIDRLFYPEKHIFLRHVLANCEPREGGYGNMVSCGSGDGSAQWLENLTYRKARGSRWALYVWHAELFRYPKKQKYKAN